MRVAIYARVSTHDQQTLPMQLRSMREYAERRGWSIVSELQEVASGAKQRLVRDELLSAASVLAIEPRRKISESEE